MFTGRIDVDLPVLSEQDDDLTGHLERFEDVVSKMNDCQAPNDIDRLELFERTLRGARKKIYDVTCRRYQKLGNLSEKAYQVLGDVLAEGSAAADHHADRQ